MGLGISASAQSTLNGTFTVTESWQVTIRQQFDPPVTYTGRTNGTLNINNGQYTLIDATGLDGGDPFNTAAHSIAGGPPYSDVGELPYAGSTLSTNGFVSVMHLGFFSIGIPTSTDLEGNVNSGSPFTITGQSLTGLSGSGNEVIDNNYYTITVTSTSSLQEQGPPPPPAPFFTGQVALANNVYWLSWNGGFFGYYNEQSFPYIYQFDMGWLYFWDADNADHGGYFYDFADQAFFYADPTYPSYIYDFTLNHWLWYEPATSTDYTSSPSWFYDLTAKTWFNHLNGTVDSK